MKFLEIINVDLNLIDQLPIKILQLLYTDEEMGLQSNHT
jgi:hypothetical protein